VPSKYILYTNFRILLATALHMEYFNNKGNTEYSCDSSFLHKRLKTTLSFLRLGGVPLHTSSPSKVQNLYNLVCVVCYYSTMMCSLMDTFVHRFDLVEAMKKTRISLAILLFAWMNFSLRYARL
jgi:hypothetical protein